MTEPQLQAMLYEMNAAQPWGQRATKLLPQYGLKPDTFYSWRGGRNLKRIALFFNVCEAFGWDCAPRPLEDKWVVPIMNNVSQRINCDGNNRLTTAGLANIVTATPQDGRGGNWRCGHCSGSLRVWPQGA
jgi:hypothetical protein